LISDCAGEEAADPRGGIVKRLRRHVQSSAPGEKHHAVAKILATDQHEDNEHHNQARGCHRTQDFAEILA
jgi:hypothetical protein